MEKTQEDFDQLKSKYLKLEKRLEAVNEKLIASEKLKSDFLSNIKNEINNPLTSILGLLSQIISEPENEERTANSASLIFNEVHALNFQMRNIFNAAEVEAGQSFPNLTSVDIKELCNETIQSLSHLAKKKGVKFNLNTSVNQFIVDREKLEVILANLISNAIKFSSDDSFVRIVASADNEGLSVEVIDEGLGIDEENLSDIYDRFKQLDSGTRKEFGGHGLGLSIVHSLVEILDGNLSMKSVVGEGSEFKITIPQKELTSEDVLEDDILFSTDEEGEVF